MSQDESTSKSKISFGLGPSSRRPGLKPTLSKPTEILETSPTLKEQRSEPLIIPCTTPISSPTLETGNETPLLPFQPNKYGLQVRKAKVNDIPTNLPPSKPLISVRRTFRNNSTTKEILEGLPDDKNDFEKIPINDYGAALLRGMGWKEGKGIGRDIDKVAEPIDPKPRPKGLGIGANPEALGATSRTLSPDSILSIGSFVHINFGEHEGMSGFVSELSSIMATVRLSGSGESVKIERSSIILSGKPKQQNIHQDPDPQPGPSWLTPNIRVKIQSKTLSNGTVYQCVAEVIDVHNDDNGIIKAILRLPDGRIIADVHDRQVEPVRPIVGHHVIILDGQNKGDRGLLIRSEGDICQIQLDDSFEFITVAYNRLAELIS